MLFFLGTTYHGGGPNRTSDQVRRGAFGKYSLGWLRQEENQFLIAPPDVARKLSPELRGLLGYRVSPPQLGWVLEPEVGELFVEEEFASQTDEATQDELWKQIEEERAKT